MNQQTPPESPPAPILVVDDRPDSLQAICAVLEPLGQPIVTAGSGDEALRQLLKHPVAVILLDVNMPGLDGFATAALIKQRVRTRHIPIIFMTAERDFAEREQIQLGYSSGAVDFLVKPFEPWTLVSKVSVFIELHRTATQLRQQVVELEVSRAALSNAQRIARLAHFTLDAVTEQVTWSDGASALFGAAVEVSAGQSPSLPFWPALVTPVDDAATARIEAHFERSDGAMISVVGHAEFIRDRAGRVREVRGTLQDVTEHAETKRALAGATDALQREHDVTALLQTAMLPTALPGAPGVDMAARYLPADVGVGGDWYDASLGVDGRLLLAIGDVAGHGLVAATMMNEIRIASRAFAMADPSPARVLQRLKNYGTSTGGPRFVTALIVLLDPVTGEASVASAGHLPPLIVDDDGARFVDLRVAPPLGVPSGPPSETTFTLQPGARLVLFTDGLVEQRGSDLDERLAKMAETVASSPDHVEATVDRLVRDPAPDRAAGRRRRRSRCRAPRRPDPAHRATGHAGQRGSDPGDGRAVAARSWSDGRRHRRCLAGGGRAGQQRDHPRLPDDRRRRRRERRPGRGHGHGGGQRQRVVANAARSGWRARARDRAVGGRGRGPRDDGGRHDRAVHSRLELAPVGRVMSSPGSPLVATFGGAMVSLGQPPALVVGIDGDVDIANAHQIERFIADGCRQDLDRLEIDLTATTYLDSGGLAMLLNLAERLNAMRVPMTVVAPPGTPAHRVIEVTGLVQRLGRVDVASGP